MPTRRLPAAILRGFVQPETEEVISPHGSQREDAIIRDFLPGWSREASAAAKEAFLPGVAAVAEGNGRGRGATLVDGFRVNPGRACGGDFLSLKAPKARATGEFPSSVELFKGTRSTLVSGLAAIAANVSRGKAFPLAIVHTDGDVFAPELIEWCVLDLGRIVTAPRWVSEVEPWDSWNGIPVKPVGDRPRGRGGSPVSVWVTFLRRERAGVKKGVPVYRFVPDSDGTYATLNTSVSVKSGHRFIAGSAEDFARDVDAATVLR